MAIGPVQMLVLGFAEPNFTGKIAAELDRLREHEFVKIVDALVVNKDENGEITALQVSDLSQVEATEMGEIAGALIGFGYGTEEAVDAGAEAGAEAGADGHLIDDEDAWYVADAIPNGTAAVILLLEHLWAIPLRDAIVDAVRSFSGRAVPASEVRQRLPDHFVTTDEQVRAIAKRTTGLEIIGPGLLRLTP